MSLLPTKLSTGYPLRVIHSVAIQIFPHLCGWDILVCWFCTMISLIFRTISKLIHSVIYVRTNLPCILCPGFRLLWISRMRSMASRASLIRRLVFISSFMGWLKIIVSDSINVSRMRMSLERCLPINCCWSRMNTFCGSWTRLG